MPLDTGEGVRFLTPASHSTTSLFTGGKNVLSFIPLCHGPVKIHLLVRNESLDVFELNCFMCFLNILVWDICLCLKTHLFISTTVYIKSLEMDSHRCCMMWVLNTIHFEKNVAFFSTPLLPR